MALLAFPRRPGPPVGPPVGPLFGQLLLFSPMVRALALLLGAALVAAPAAVAAIPPASQPAGQAAQPIRAGAGPEGLVIPLQCRLREGPWQDCRMKVEQVGTHWFLLLDGQTIEFRHDGRGAVTMQQQGSEWRPVNSRWQEDTSLCWDGVCAKGQIPLD